MLELYEPNIEDLWFKEKMMSDEQTMSTIMPMVE